MGSCRREFTGAVLKVHELVGSEALRMGVAWVKVDQRMGDVPPEGGDRLPIPLVVMFQQVAYVQRICQKESRLSVA
jgi:hypothetical protein